MIELFNCTQVLLREIAMTEARQKDVSATYALAIRSSDHTDWITVNRAIINRWGVSGKLIIKVLAQSCDVDVKTVIQ